MLGVGAGRHRRGTGPTRVLVRTGATKAVEAGVGVDQIPEQVVERPVFQHEDDHMVNRRWHLPLLRREPSSPAGTVWQSGATRAVLTASQSGEASRGRYDA